MKEGNATLCPDAGELVYLKNVSDVSTDSSYMLLFSDPVKVMNRSVQPGGIINLRCPSPSNLAQTRWELNDQILTPSARVQLQEEGLVIVNASESDAGRYRCLSLEHSKTTEYRTTVAEYRVTVAAGDSGTGRTGLAQAQTDGPSVTGLVAVVGLLVICLVALLAWNFYKGHLPLPWKLGPPGDGGPNSTEIQQDDGKPECKPLVLGTNSGGGNNNHTGGKAAEVNHTGDSEI